MTDHTTGQAPPQNSRRRPHDNRRQVLYWRLLARLFDNEEQATLESASLAVVEDIGLPPALLDPQASVDSIVQRHPELAAEFDGLMAPEPDPSSDPDDDARDRAAEVRRAALVSKVLLNVFSMRLRLGHRRTAGALAVRRGLAGARARLPTGRDARWPRRGRRRGWRRG